MDKTMLSLLLVLSVIGVTLAGQSSPLFMWNVNSVSKPALSTVSEDEFIKIVRPFLAENAVIVFEEENLTNRDFMCADEASSKSCFARLQGVSKKNYFTSVDNPAEALRSISDNVDNISVDRSGKLSSPLHFEAGKVIFVSFDEDKQPQRSSSLEWHDNVMATITAQYADSNVFFAYISKESPASSNILKRERRHTAAAKSGNIFRHGADLLVYFSSLFAIDGTGKRTELKIASMSVTNTNATFLSVKLAGDGDVTFDVTLSGGYFFMKNVKYNSIDFRSNHVYSPTDFSYFCGDLNLYSGGNASSSSILEWKSFQFQAPFGSTKNDKFIFGDPWHCVGFFTHGILSGLLIVALLLSISFVGVCWMMDINTMDRFDDPKGKTITINAND